MDHHKLAKLAMCLAMLCLGTVTALLGVWRSRSWLRGIARKVFGEMDLRTLWRKPADPVEQRVAAICRERRVEQGRVTLAFMVCVGLAFESFHLLRLLMDHPAMPLEPLALLQALVCTCMLAGMFPCSVTAKSIDFFFSWNILLIVAAIITQSRDDRMLDAEDMRLWIAALCCCLFDIKPWLNTIGLVLVAAACSFTGMPDAYMAWCYCLVVAVMVCWIDCRLKAGIRLEILTTDSGQQLAAVKKLLGTICDVVVELDENLRLTQHSAKLSDVLLSGSGRCLQGATIQEFMPEEADREMFVKALSGTDGAQAHAEVLHANVSDCNATQISMEFFSVAFVGPDTHPRHLLGMREFTDILPLMAELRPPQHGALQERTARQSWPGTPASPEREEIAQRYPSEDAASEVSSSGGRQPGAAQGPRPRMLTDRVARVGSLMATLMSWQVQVPEDACCPLHARVAEVRRLLVPMRRWGCSAAFGPAGDWQCQRCGIVAEEYREKGRRSAREGCLLCKDLELQGARRLGGAAALVAL